MIGACGGQMIVSFRPHCVAMLLPSRSLFRVLLPYFLRRFTLLAAHSRHRVGDPFRRDWFPENEWLEEVDHEHPRGNQLCKKSVIVGPPSLVQKHVAGPL